MFYRNFETLVNQVARNHCIRDFKERKERESVPRWVSREVQGPQRRRKGIRSLEKEKGLRLSGKKYKTFSSTLFCLVSYLRTCFSLRRFSENLIS